MALKKKKLLSYRTSTVPEKQFCVNIGLSIFQLSSVNEK